MCVRLCSPPFRSSCPVSKKFDTNFTLFEAAQIAYFQFPAISTSNNKVVESRTYGAGATHYTSQAWNFCSVTDRRKTRDVCCGDKGPKLYYTLNTAAIKSFINTRTTSFRLDRYYIEIIELPARSRQVCDPHHTRVEDVAEEARLFSQKKVVGDAYSKIPMIKKYETKYFDAMLSTCRLLRYNYRHSHDFSLMFVF